jgi:hypothetical protein
MSAVAHPDLDRLLNFCLPFAQDQIVKQGSFHPFAATVQRDGQVTPLAVPTDDEHPEAQATIEEFVRILKEMAMNRRFLAGAVCYDSKVTSKDDPQREKNAIAVALEHENGECMTVYLPYRKKYFGGYRYAAVMSVSAERRLFV